MSDAISCVLHNYTSHLFGYQNHPLLYSLILSFISLSPILLSQLILLQTSDFTVCIYFEFHSQYFLFLVDFMRKILQLLFLSFWFFWFFFFSSFLLYLLFIPLPLILCHFLHILDTICRTIYRLKNWAINRANLFQCLIQSSGSALSRIWSSEKLPILCSNAHHTKLRNCKQLREFKWRKI